MELTTVWFILIAVLWIGYFVLEGFDFGVGILQPCSPATRPNGGSSINTIGPVWDGNEVWLLVAGGATFAAFPEWYATLFSGFYLPLLLILLALIFRNVAFEYRGKRERRRVESLVGPRHLLRLAAARAAVGRRLRQHRARRPASTPDKEFTGTFFDLLNPYALLGGAATLSLFVTHGAVFLALKTDGDIRAAGAGSRAQVRADRRRRRSQLPGLDAVSAAAQGRPSCSSPSRPRALVAGLAAASAGREGWAFFGTVRRASRSPSPACSCRSSPT